MILKLTMSDRTGRQSFLAFLLAVFGLLVMAGALLTSCASVPKEVVELSYRMGEDILALQESYVVLIHKHFESLKAQRVEYLESEWTPAFVRAWVDSGRLREIAKGDIVWSEDAEEFVRATPGRKEAELLASIGFWSQSAIEQIEDKRAELLAPLDSQEVQLQSWVAEAFSRIYRGNATITAHLNSLRKVQEVQDNFLEAMDIKDLRDKINNALISSSEVAQKALDEVRRADGLLTEGKKVAQTK